MNDLPQGNWTGSYLEDLSRDSDTFKLHVLREKDELVTRTAKNLAASAKEMKFGFLSKSLDRMKKNCHPPYLPDMLLYIEEAVCSCASLGFVGTAGSTIAESIELMRTHGVCSSRGPTELQPFVFIIKMLLAFIQLKFQGQNVSSFEAYQKAIWVTTVSLILYCFTYEAELRLLAYSRVIRRGTIVLGSVSSVSLTSIFFPENHRLSSARMEAANGMCREQERLASTTSVRNESYGGLRVICVSVLLCSVLF
ncbi:hypothetical protein ACSBR1_038458 [Camellia fascicularis]